MAFSIETLTRELMLQRVHDFVRLAKSNIEGEYWESDNFLAELKNKWVVSLLVKDEAKKIVAFLIASEKESSTHIHKFVVDLSVRQLGVGTMLFDELKRKSAKAITLKVQKDNEDAIQFYLKKGFVVVGSQNDMHLMTYR